MTNYPLGEFNLVCGSVWLNTTYLDGTANRSSLGGKAFPDTKSKLQTLSASSPGNDQTGENHGQLRVQQLLGAKKVPTSLIKCFLSHCGNTFSSCFSTEDTENKQGVAIPQVWTQQTNFPPSEDSLLVTGLPTARSPKPASFTREKLLQDSRLLCYRMISQRDQRKQAISKPGTPAFLIFYFKMLFCSTYLTCAFNNSSPHPRDCVRLWHRMSGLEC